MNERLRSCKHHVKNDTSTPDVYFLVVFALSKDFRRRKLNCACFRHELLILSDLFGHVKINDRNSLVSGDDQVLRLDIPVYYFVLVEIINTL